MKENYHIVAINLGSTSTKLVYYENERCVIKTNIIHAAEELVGFPTIWDQREYRVQAIQTFLNEHNIDLKSLDAVVTRGGHTHPIVGGVWKITDNMIEESRSEKFGNHATDLGLQLARELAGDNALALTVDPPTTDEFEPEARLSGCPLLPRASRFHVLNHRAVGKQYAKETGKKYKDLNLVVAHMGGGITVAAHKKGLLVDATNGLDGDGPYSTDRSGGLPAGALVDLCFSEKHSKQEIKRMIKGEGGLMAYLGENDVKTVQEAALSGDQKAALALSGMIYQTAKEIAAMASVLCGEVDAILLTGGIMNSSHIASEIEKRVGFIAPVRVYPGELEMQSLAMTSLAALRGEEPIKEF